MSSIAGLFSLNTHPVKNISQKLEVMNNLQKHRGPDGEGIWIRKSQTVGFAHRCLNTLDLYADSQPMKDNSGNRICFNGVIYNNAELRKELGGEYLTNSDTEVLLRAYQKWGSECVNHLKGMFAFAIWNEREQTLFCARDQLGIKPLYYYKNGDLFAFASEIKALLPVMREVNVSAEGLKDYLTFQFCLEGKTLYENVYECPPANTITAKDGYIDIRRYWQLDYNLDWNHSEKYFIEELERLIINSVRRNMRSDAPIGGFVSGGIDSSIISALAYERSNGEYMGFTGKFTEYDGYDESTYAQNLADQYGFELLHLDISLNDFLENIEKVVYYLDQPVAGPGSFCQYMISSLAARHRKVLLGGQGGDEIFGGYTRYLVAYFEQCIKGAIDGTMNSGNFIVTYESIIPNLVNLRNYKPMLKSFWQEGLFHEIDKRYTRLVNRAPDIQDCVHWDCLGIYNPLEVFRGIFNSQNVHKASYFDKMLHCDFKTSLPAILQVEDRMSMAHGLESRPPFMDLDLIEFVATIPASFKLKDGNAKYILKESLGKYLPQSILDRKDKMGFPVPFVEWAKGPAKEFVIDILSSQSALNREFIDNRRALEKLQGESTFGRNIWGLLSLELWQRQFLDKAAEYRTMTE